MDPLKQAKIFGEKSRVIEQWHMPELHLAARIRAFGGHAW